MPSLTMRGRYLMREYWSDADLFLKLSPIEREVYVGLWMLADDAGWMPRDVTEIAAALYRYEAPDVREELVRATLLRLRTLGKVESTRCGCLHLPAVERYPRAGKKSNEHLIAHQTHSTASKRIQTHSNGSPVPSLPFPSSSSPDRASARDDGSETEEEGTFSARMAAAGLDVSRIGGKH